jgi:hypothetical protein
MMNRCNLLISAGGVKSRGSELLHYKAHAESDIVHDAILFYVKSESFTWKPQYIPFSD